MSAPLAVQLLEEGFLHPAAQLDAELTGDNGILHVPVHELSTEVQFFRCRVEGTLATTAAEYVVADSGSSADIGVASRVLSERFAGATLLFLRSQNTGRAAVECPANAPLSLSAAAAVAMILCSAGGDDSEEIAIEGGGTRHVLSVSTDDNTHWVSDRSDVACACGLGPRVVPRQGAWWIETPQYSVPLPVGWTLSAHVCGSSPLFQLHGRADASITVRTSRRMPALESFQGPGHRFRDIGQLARAGWIEFEHTEGANTWLHRHEQLHRGTAPFVVTLIAPLDRADEHMQTLARIVEQLELPASQG